MWTDYSGRAAQWVPNKKGGRAYDSEVKGLAAQDQNHQKILQTLKWHKSSSINFNNFTEADWLIFLDFFLFFSFLESKCENDCLVVKNNQTLRQHAWWNHLVNNNRFTILQAYKTSTSSSDQCSLYWAGPSTSHWSHTQKWQIALRHTQQYSRTLLQDNGWYNHNDFSDEHLIRTRIHGKGTAGYLYISTTLP